MRRWKTVIICLGPVVMLVVLAQQNLVTRSSRPAPPDLAPALGKANSRRQTDGVQPRRSSRTPPELFPAPALSTAATDLGPRPEPAPEAAAGASRRFEAEPVDGRWAEATAERLRAALATRGHLDSSRSVECRTSLCRAWLVFTDGTEVGEFVDHSLRSEVRVWDGETSLLKTGETTHGLWTVVAYFSRAEQSADTR